MYYAIRRLLSLSQNLNVSGYTLLCVIFLAHFLERVTTSKISVWIIFIQYSCIKRSIQYYFIIFLPSIIVSFFLSGTIVSYFYPVSLYHSFYQVSLYHSFYPVSLLHTFYPVSLYYTFYAVSMYHIIPNTLQDTETQC